jgi:hypothetical protein
MQNVGLMYPAIVNLRFHVAMDVIPEASFHIKKNSPKEGKQLGKDAAELLWKSYPKRL